MSYSEGALTFTCEQATLFGILAAPQKPASTGVIVIVGGPQYRAGSHRQFVLLSRALATGGYPVLRFDYQGMGDSTGNPRDFSAITIDIKAAIDAMQAKMPGVSRLVLWGLCDGASAALLYCHETKDPRVTGLCLLNPWVRSEASLARAHVKHYYADRLKQKEFWLKLLSGKIAVAAASDLWRNVNLSIRRGTTPAVGHAPPFQSRMALAWASFKGSIALVISGHDYTAKEFLEYADTATSWSGLVNQPCVVQIDLPDADHTFSRTADRLRLEALTLNWLQTHAPQ